MNILPSVFIPVINNAEIYSNYITPIESYEVSAPANTIFLSIDENCLAYKDINGNIRYIF